MEIVKSEKKRFHLIDEYRGFVVINMIAYHAIWDLVYMFGVDWQWYKSDIGFVWQQWICWSFILVSGFCWKMGKEPWKRGFQVYAGGVVISAVTFLFMPEARVMFGILTFLGSAMILMIPLDLLLKKVRPVFGGVISFLLFLFTYPVNSGYFGFGEQKLISLPEELYANGFTTYLGFDERGFFSTDYFSILPWFFLYVTGYFIYSFIFGGRKNNCPEAVETSANKIQNMLSKSICPPFGGIGKHALIIYMLHQPVVYGVLSVWRFLCQ